MSVTENTTFTMKKVAFSWTSDGSGDATEVTTGSFSGKLESVVQIPGSGGSQPTAAYDVVVNDEDSVDVLQGQGADLSNSANTYKNSVDGLGSFTNTKLTIVVSNAGDTKSGQTILYFR